MTILGRFTVVLLFISVSLIFSNTENFAQQIPQLANFMNNQQVFNPSAMGMQETELNVALLSRLQYSGIDGAPKSSMLWADYRFDGNRSAVGINLNRTTFGVNRIVDAIGNYGYTLKLSPRFKLAMGLRVGVSMLHFNSLDPSKIWDGGDPYEENPYVNTSNPLAGMGFRFYDSKFQLGFSAPDLIMKDKYNVYNNKGKSFFEKRRNYILTSGYKIRLSDAYTLKPNLMLMYFPSTNLRADVNLSFEIRDYFWAGATYSTSHFNSLIIGTHISSALRASYGFQLGMGKNIPSKFYTHEISLMLNLDVLKK